MEYKGYIIVPGAAGWIGANDIGYTFNIHKKTQGDNFINVHRSRMEGHFAHEVFAFDAAVKAARALIDAGGPFTPDSP